MIDVTQAELIAGVVAGVIAVLAGARFKRSKASSPHDEAIRAWLGSEEGRKLIHAAAKHEISNAVFIVSAAINAEEPPECIDGYRRRVVRRVVEEFRGWKE